MSIALAAAATAWSQEGSVGADPTNVLPDVRVQSEVVDDGEFFSGLDQRLKELVVTASGGAAEERELAAANIVSIGQDEIARRGFQSLAEIIGSVPGFYVIDDLVAPSVGIRGITGGLRASTRVVKLMINGAQVNFRPDLAAAIGPEFVPIDAIERVEIAKGPLSALYGANAFLATVNVVTKRPPAGQEAMVTGRFTLIRDRPGGGASAMLRYSSENAGLLVAVTADRLDRSGLSLEKTFNGQDPSLPRFSAFFDSRSQGDTSTPIGLFTQFWGRSPKWGNLSVQGGFQHSDSMGEFQLNSVLTHRTRISTDNVWASARADRKWNDHLTTWLTIGGSYGAPTRDTAMYLTKNTSYSFRPNFDYREFEVAAGVDLTFDPVTINIGLDYWLEAQRVLYYTQVFAIASGVRNPGDLVDLISESDLKNVTLTNPGVYAQASAAPFRKLPQLHFSANARVDLPNLFPAQFSWRASVAYRWNNAISTKLILGRAYQAPSAVLLYGQPGFGDNDNVIGSLTAGVKGSLKPQVVQSAEVVMSASFLSRGTVEVAAYAQQVDDKIEFVKLATNYVARNLGVSRTFGAEITARLAINRFSPYLGAATQLMLLQDPLRGDLAVQTVTPLFPSGSVFVGLNVSVPEAYFDANIHFQVVGARGASQGNTQYNNDVSYTLAPYAMLNATLLSKGVVLLGERETRLSLSIRNVLDSRPFEPGFGGFDLPTIGRTLMLQVRQSL